MCLCVFFYSYISSHTFKVGSEMLPPPLRHFPSSVQLSTWEGLNYMHMVFTIFVNRLKKFFEQTKI